MATNVERMSIYVDTVKIGEALNASYTHMTQDEQFDADDGSDFFSRGNDRSEWQFETVTPEEGHEADLAEAALEHRTVTVAGIVDGALESAEGRFESRAYKTNHKDGSLTGDFKVKGGKPKRT